MPSFFKRHTKKTSVSTIPHSETRAFALGDGTLFDPTRLGPGIPDLTQVQIKRKMLKHHLQPALASALIATARFSSPQVSRRPSSTWWNSAEDDLADYQANEAFIVRGVGGDSWMYVQSMHRSTKDLRRIPQDPQLFTLSDARGQFIHADQWESAFSSAGLDASPHLRRILSPTEQTGEHLGMIDPRERFYFKAPKHQHRKASPSLPAATTQQWTYSGSPAQYHSSNKRMSVGRKW